jgi:hypothetical protein
MDDELRRENWSLSGPNALVKVVAANQPRRSELGGYFTVGKFLVGKRCSQLERALGLPTNELALGARIYRFKRLPLRWEYEYELTAQYPDGLAFNPAHSDPRYGPGSAYIHQWRIADGARIPADPVNFLDLAPGLAFPYSWLVA